MIPKRNHRQVAAAEGQVEKKNTLVEAERRRPKSESTGTDTATTKPKLTKDGIRKLYSNATNEDRPAKPLILLAYKFSPLLDEIRSHSCLLSDGTFTHRANFQLVAPPTFPRKATGAIVELLGYVMSEDASMSTGYPICITAYKLRGFQYARGTPKKETPCKSSCCGASNRLGLAWKRVPKLLEACRYDASKLLVGSDDHKIQPIVDALTKLRDHHEAMGKLSDAQLKHGEDAYAPAAAIAQRYQQACKQYIQCITKKLGFDLDSAIAGLDKVFEMGSKQTLNQSVERCWHQIVFRKPLANADPFATDLQETKFYPYCQILNQLKAKSLSMMDHLMYMAVALFGLAEGDPFSQYNDSLAAVLMMWIFKECNLPLRVSDGFLHETEFMEAMDATRSYISLVPRGTASADLEIQRSLSSPGDVAKGVPYKRATVLS